MPVTRDVSKICILRCSLLLLHFSQVAISYLLISTLYVYNLRTIKRTKWFFFESLTQHIRYPMFFNLVMVDFVSLWNFFHLTFSRIRHTLRVKFIRDYAFRESSLRHDPHDYVFRESSPRLVQRKIHSWPSFHVNHITWLKLIRDYDPPGIESTSHPSLAFFFFSRAFPVFCPSSRGRPFPSHITRPIN